MSSDRISGVLAALPALLFAGDQLGMRCLLEELYEGAQTDLLGELRGVEQAAAVWEVTDRRARAHIARLHEKYGIGQQFGGAWLIRRQDIEHHPPDRRYRKKEL